MTYYKKIIRSEYMLEEKSAKDIAKCWKIVPILLYLLAAGGGIAASIGLGNIWIAFLDRCILYSKIEFLGLNNLPNGSLVLRESNVNVISWGLSGDCYFAQYGSVASVMVSAIFITFFSMCGRGGDSAKRLKQPWRIVPPAFLVDLLFFFINCVIISKVLGGFSSFCQGATYSSDSNLHPYYNSTDCEKIFSFQYPWKNWTGHGSMRTNYKSSQIGVIFSCVIWLLLLLFMMLRCWIPVDFKVYRRDLIAYGPTSPRTESEIPQPGPSFRRS